jgi:uncharacterized membrane protein/osmotically-inducible protein OsmY
MAQRDSSLLTQRGSLLAGLGAGAAAMFFLDPSRGARRRARVRDAATHATHLAADACATTSRDAWHRAKGTVAVVRNVVGRDHQVDDAVLIGRVRAKLGREVSHPHAIQVDVMDGDVTLSGPVLEREAENLVHVVEKIPGVCGVIDQLQRHEHAGNIPALQGGRQPAGDHYDVWQMHWAPATRATAIVGGAALVAAAARRRGPAAIAATIAGALLIGRAATNAPLVRLLGLGGGRRAVDIHKTIWIAAPVEAVYAFWSSFENFPMFMSRVLDVRSSDRTPGLSHWSVAGPAGVPVTFDAEVTRAIPNQVLAWRTLPGSPVAHAGIVDFERDADGTRAQVRMSYNPPAGWIGHGVAMLFGVDPKHGLDEDLVRMKTLIETGIPPRDAAQPVVR